MKVAVDSSWKWLCDKVVDPALGLPKLSDLEDDVPVDPRKACSREETDSPVNGIATNKSIVDTVIQLLEQKGLPLFDELLDVETLRLQISQK